MPDTTPLRDSIDRIGKDGDGFDFGISRTPDGKVAGEVEGSKSLGRGWSIGGGWRWVKDMGQTIFFGGSWKPGAKK